MDDFEPAYERWRHGGWYVTNVRYPNGAIGCVSNNYPDRKWRIVCGRPHDETFPTRDAAARAEHAIVAAMPPLPKWYVVVNIEYTALSVYGSALLDMARTSCDAINTKFPGARLIYVKGDRPSVGQTITGPFYSVEAQS